MRDRHSKSQMKKSIVEKPSAEKFRLSVPISTRSVHIMALDDEGGHRHGVLHSKSKTCAQKVFRDNENRNEFHPSIQKDNKGKVKEIRYRNQALKERKQNKGRMKKKKKKKIRKKRKPLGNKAKKKTPPTRKTIKQNRRKTHKSKYIYPRHMKPQKYSRP